MAMMMVAVYEENHASCGKTMACLSEVKRALPPWKVPMSSVSRRASPFNQQFIYTSFHTLTHSFNACVFQLVKYWEAFLPEAKAIAWRQQQQQQLLAASLVLSCCLHHWSSCHVRMKTSCRSNQAGSTWASLAFPITCTVLCTDMPLAWTCIIVMSTPKTGLSTRHSSRLASLDGKTAAVIFIKLCCSLCHLWFCFCLPVYTLVTVLLMSFQDVSNHHVFNSSFDSGALSLLKWNDPNKFGFGVQ